MALLQKSSIQNIFLPIQSQTICDHKISLRPYLSETDGSAASDKDMIGCWVERTQPPTSEKPGSTLLRCNR